MSSRRADKIARKNAKGWALNNKLPAAVRKKHKRFGSKAARAESRKDVTPERRGTPSGDTDGPVELCDRCLISGGHPMMCETCGTVLCTNCDVHNGCPGCGGETS